MPTIQEMVQQLQAQQQSRMPPMLANQGSNAYGPIQSPYTPNQFQGMAGQNPTAAVQMMKYGNEAWRQAVAQKMGWDQNAMNSFINQNAPGSATAQGNVYSANQALAGLVRNQGATGTAAPKAAVDPAAPAATPAGTGGIDYGALIQELGKQYPGLANMFGSQQGQPALQQSYASDLMQRNSALGGGGNYANYNDMRNQLMNGTFQPTQAYSGPAGYQIPGGGYGQAAGGYGQPMMASDVMGGQPFGYSNASSSFMPSTMMAGYGGGYADPYSGQGGGYSNYPGTGGGYANPPQGSSTMNQGYGNYLQGAGGGKTPDTAMWHINGGGAMPSFNASGMLQAQRYAQGYGNVYQPYGGRQGTYATLPTNNTMRYSGLGG